MFPGIFAGIFPAPAGEVLSGGVIALATDGTFTRASDGTYQTSASTLAVASSNVRRFEDRGDASGLLIERQHANTIPNSRDLTAGTWTSANTYTTANAAVGPDGLTKADRQNVPANVLGKYDGLSGAGHWSFWARSVSGTATLQFWAGGSDASFNSVSLGTTWQRVYSEGAVSAPINVVTCDGRSSVAKGHSSLAQDFYFDFFQYDTSSLLYALSPIETAASTVTVEPDKLEFASGSWDSALASGVVTYTIRPLWAPADLQSGNLRWLWSIGGSSDGVRIRNDGTGTLVEMLDGGSVVASSGYMTHARDAEVEIIIDASVGQITLDGVAGSVGTAPSWSTATIARLGGIQGASSGSGNEIDARIISVIA